jgi:hypothetical protein
MPDRLRRDTATMGRQPCCRLVSLEEGSVSGPSHRTCTLPDGSGVAVDSAAGSRCRRIGRPLEARTCATDDLV